MRPFRIHMANGESFDVRHPEMARVGRNFLILFTFVSNSPDLLDRWETISLMLMERVSHLDAQRALGRQLTASTVRGFRSLPCSWIV